MEDSKKREKEKKQAGEVREGKEKENINLLYHIIVYVFIPLALKGLSE